MSSQHVQNQERPDPIPERIGLGIFTDREYEMDSLMEWAEMVAEKWGRSQALVSHRRYGKTAILERFYNRLFWERDDVMPFYFEIHDGVQKIWINKLAKLYLYSFLQQFLAYRTRDAALAFRAKTSPETLSEIAEKAGETYVVEMIDWWERDKSLDESIKVDRVLQNLPQEFAVETGLSIIVMFDEFQRLNQVLYEDEAYTVRIPRYTNAYSTAAESSRAPMLVAGSQVTNLTEYALMGSMMGRVKRFYIDRLPIYGAMALVLKYAQKRKIDISLDMAHLISQLVVGNPFYIWCLFTSRYPQRNLTTEEGIKQTLTFEVENRAGNINEFWRHQFAQDMEAFNRTHARQMIFYLTQYGEDEVRVEKLMKDLELPLSVAETNEILRQLVWCDLVRENGNEFYGGLSDPQLQQMLKIEYSWEIKELTRRKAIAEVQADIAEKTEAYKDELIAKLKGELRTWVGRFAEMFIEKLMKRHFTDQMVDGGYFNQSEKVQLSRFDSVYTTMTQRHGATRTYQIDVYAVPLDPNHTPWVVEVKNWKDPVSKPDVEKLWHGSRNLAKDKGHPQVVCWFYARSGFTGPAITFMQEKGMLYTDEDGLVQMLEEMGVIDQWRE
ncbi:MAG: restriction endonuclease [Chloroflexota bacterium]